LPKFRRKDILIHKKTENKVRKVGLSGSNYWVFPIEMINISAGIRIAATGLTVPKSTNMIPNTVRDIPDITSPFKPVPTML
jgi:hypothetical protein